MIRGNKQGTGNHNLKASDIWLNCCLMVEGFLGGVYSYSSVVVFKLRCRDREGETESQKDKCTKRALIHCCTPQMTTMSATGPGPKLGATSIRCYSQVPGTQLFDPSLLPPQVCTSTSR